MITAIPGAPPSTGEPREQLVLDAFSSTSGRVSIGRVRETLAAAGLHHTDPRLAHLREELAPYGMGEELPRERFLDHARPSMLMLEQVVTGAMVIPEFDRFASQIGEIFQSVRANRDGEVADYIPKLSRVDPELYAASLCTVDGQRADLGDADTAFSCQCIHKPLTYCFALEDSGFDEVHRRVGCEPSGRGFNEIALDREGRPHNPMLNAGSIMCSGLVGPSLETSERFEHVLDRWQAMAGGERPGFDNATYLSERSTADRNHALTYYMREHNGFPAGVDAFEALDLYLQSCSLEVTTRLVSSVAATLASGGICPLTGERVLQPRAVQRCLSFMYSCGMYDYSGRWAFGIGLPAKSGVSGGVMVVVPNVLGLCVWSPRLEAHGNSVRGIEFCRSMVERFNFHVYDSVGDGASGKLDPRRRREADGRQLLVDLCWAAAEGDCEGVSRLVVLGASVSGADYDGRTPMHLAASEGRADAVELLLRLGADPAALDRWGNTPLDDASRAGHHDVATLLAGRPRPAGASW